MSRITLRPLSEDDLPLIEPWYGEGAAVVHRERLAIVRDGAPIGYIDYRVGKPAEGWLTTDVIAVAANLRGRGYGGEAVRLLEESHPARRYLANLNPRNGLSLYFWLRMGYRPARHDEIFWRAPDEGTIAMIRSADDERA